MAALHIRNLDEATKAALRLRAAQTGISMEEAARRILRAALGAEGSVETPGQRLKARFSGVATGQFRLPERQKMSA